MKKSGLIILALIFPNTPLADVLHVGLIDKDRPPYFFKPSESSPAHGMYIDILDEIGKQTGITFNYKFLPQKRIRAYMKKGILDVEPGIDPSWRVEPGEAENSLYSSTLFSSEEVLVYNPNRFTATPSIEELVNYTSCMVMGFNGIEENKSSEISKHLTSEAQILELISLQRCDWALFPIDVVDKMVDDLHLAYTAPVETYELSIRFHIKHVDIMDDVNKAIYDMKQTGRLSEIVDAYLSE